jgi:hypothetical protein
MPTGYTSYLIDKDEISFSKFAMICARAFGSCVDMRDDSMNKDIPERFEESSYHKTNYEQDLKELEKFNSSNTDILFKQYENEQDLEIKSRNEYLEKNKLQIQRYDLMLQKVNKWNPPTQEHMELKNFMIKQIRESIKFDDMQEYYKNNPIIKLSFEQWKYNKIEKIKKDIEYHMKEWQKETKRVAERNKWIKDLRNSLPTE